MINALFVETNGIYFKDPRVIPWDKKTNAFNCRNGFPAICHPPCERWGRYWSGGPSVKRRKVLGDDGGAFAFCLWYVRTYGGVIEHPEASRAFDYYGLETPPKKGGWVSCDKYGGWACCVEQGNYGHEARKATWLYFNGSWPIDLKWGPSEAKVKFETSLKDSSLRGQDGYKPAQKLSDKQRLATPKEFKELLITMVDKLNE